VVKGSERVGFAVAGALGVVLVDGEAGWVESVASLACSEVVSTWSCWASSSGAVGFLGLLVVAKKLSLVCLYWRGPPLAAGVEAGRFSDMAVCCVEKVESLGGTSRRFEVGRVWVVAGKVWMRGHRSRLLFMEIPMSGSRQAESNVDVDGWLSHCLDEGRSEMVAGKQPCQDFGVRAAQ